jgi:hypothetical protein
MPSSNSAASCQPLTERRDQPITGIRQHAAKAHTGSDGMIDLRQSHLRFRSCRSRGKKQPQRQHDRDFASRQRQRYQGLAVSWRTSGGPTHPDPSSSPTLRLEPLGRNRVKSGDRREKWNAFGTLLLSRIRLVSSHFACCKRFASSRSCPTIAVKRRWTALARSGYLIRDLANPCQPTAYLCPKAEDGNRRKSVLQRARQRSG